MRKVAFLFLPALLAAPAAVQAQVQFGLFGRSVQVHGFVSQGFVYSNQNNYLTMNTSDGSGAFTDGGFNMSMPVTDKFRVGAQAYVRNIGQLGKGHVELDWAYGDYRFAEWFGVRAGKVKTVLGLYNDTQDTEALHTWALLPQSVYPLDLRSNTIAHKGGDIYGQFNLHKGGTLSYTGYYGARSFDPRGGYYYFSADQGIPISKTTGRSAGGDLRWMIGGLTVGGSVMDQTQDREGKYTAFFQGMSYKFVSDPQRAIAAYGDFTHGNWHFSGEYRRDQYKADISTLGTPMVFVWNGDEKGWFASAAYRVSKHLELGTYHSRYSIDQPANPADKNSDHIYDQTVTARIDINRFWNVKVEGHFMDGYGDIYSAHGFYSRSNPNGMKPTTHMLVLRTGWNF